jgi:hypothetical protein
MKRIRRRLQEGGVGGGEQEGDISADMELKVLRIELSGGWGYIQK